MKETEIPVLFSHIESTKDNSKKVSWEPGLARRLKEATSIPDAVDRNKVDGLGFLSRGLKLNSEEWSVYRMAMRVPAIRGWQVPTFKKMINIIESHFSWLKERDDFDRLIEHARLFYALYGNWMEKRVISRQFILDGIGDCLVSDETVKEWVKGISLPQIFGLIHNGLSVSEGCRIRDEIISSLNGITSHSEYKRTMNRLYITRLLVTHKNHSEENDRVEQFFRFLEALKQGGLHSDFARRSGAPKSTTKTWILYRTIPRYIKYAASVPKSPPGRGKRWLPLSVRESGLGDFIKVPLRIRRASDIEEVMDQLTPHTSGRMKNWAKTYPELEGATAFMYLLGAIFSDGSFGRKTGSTTRVRLTASDTYNWSVTFGEAFSYCLGLLGLRVSRRSREYKEKTGAAHRRFEWESKHSSILGYMRSSLFGLRGHQTKARDSVEMEWVLDLETPLRIGFLRGVADGDGFATVRAFHAGISSKANKRFLMRLLDSLGIESRSYRTGVRIDKTAALRRSAETGLFYTAGGKSLRLKQIVSMLDAMNRKRIKDEEKEIIVKLYNEGLTDGEIICTLWSEYGIARRPTTIDAFLRRIGLKSS